MKQLLRAGKEREMQKHSKSASAEAPGYRTEEAARTECSRTENPQKEHCQRMRRRI